MFYMVILVVDDSRQCTDVMNAWEEAGVAGITILESTGLGRYKYRTGLRDDMPLMPSLRSVMQSREEKHRTLFSVVEGEEMVDRLIEATESAIGSLDVPNTGILLALPVARVKGIASQEEIERFRKLGK